MSNFHCIHTVPSQLGESPRWHPGEEKIYWTDIDGHRLWRIRLDGSEAESVELDQKAGCIVLRNKGGLVLAMEDGIYAANPFSNEPDWELLCPHPDPQLARIGGRFNDGRCDPQGRLYVGTLDPQRKGRASLYCLEPGTQKAQLIQTGFSTFNGLAFHPDGKQVWYADTPTRQLYRSSYDAVTGAFGPRECVTQWPKTNPARPDGAGFDSNGDYWCAMYAGGCVLRIDGNGAIKEKIKAPATYTTMVGFVGDKLRNLVLTSALRDDDPDEENRNPEAGCLFVLDREVPASVPESAFAG